MTQSALSIPGKIEERESSLPHLALGLIIVFALGKLLLHLLTTAFTPYGIHRDEFLYLAMGQHLHFWRMDFPPAIAVLANAARFLFGDTLFQHRLLCFGSGRGFPVNSSTTGLSHTLAVPRRARRLGGWQRQPGRPTAARLACHDPHGRPAVPATKSGYLCRFPARANWNARTNSCPCVGRLGYIALGKFSACLSNAGLDLRCRVPPIAPAPRETVLPGPDLPGAFCGGCRRSRKQHAEMGSHSDDDFAHIDYRRRADWAADGITHSAAGTNGSVRGCLGSKSAVTTNRKEVLSLPQDYADMLGWEEQVASVARAYESLSSGQRAQAALLARNYGEAGALEFFGPRHGLPSTILLPDNFLLWPAPTNRTCEVVVSIGISERDLAAFFKSVRLVTRFDNPWMVPEEKQVVICIAEYPVRDVREAWHERKWR